MRALQQSLPSFKKREESNFSFTRENSANDHRRTERRQRQDRAPVEQDLGHDGRDHAFQQEMRENTQQQYTVYSIQYTGVPFTSPVLREAMANGLYFQDNLFRYLASQSRCALRAEVEKRMLGLRTLFLGATEHKRNYIIFSSHLTHSRRTSS